MKLVAFYFNSQNYEKIMGMADSSIANTACKSIYFFDIVI